MPAPTWASVHGARWPRLCVWLCLGATVSRSVALRVPFNYAWRFHRGTTTQGGFPSCSYQQSLDNTSHCTHLEHDPNRFTAEDCRISCCYNPTCKAWFVNYTVIPHCFHGYQNSRCGPLNLATAPAPPPARQPAQGGYRAGTAALCTCTLPVPVNLCCPSLVFGPHALLTLLTSHAAL